MNKAVKQTSGAPDAEQSIMKDEADTPFLEGNDDLNGVMITTQPQGTHPICPPGLDLLLDTGQLVIHTSNLRFNHKLNEDAAQRMEVIDETRRHIFTVEQAPSDSNDSSFNFLVFSKENVLVARFFNPSSHTVVKCGASWHCCKRCRFQTVVYCPEGQIIGFVKRSHTYFIQEYEIQDSVETCLLVLRGGPQDLELYSPDMKTELGRLSVHGWHGIMHEVRRSNDDYGLTFPIDLDVRVKVILLASVFATHWIYKNRGVR